jgi:hypothetical protein
MLVFQLANNSKGGGSLFQVGFDTIKIAFKQAAENT